MAMETQASDDVLFEELAATLGTRPKYPEYDEQGYVIELDLSHLNITQLPEELRELTHLQRLNLSNNQLTQILPELGQLANLQNLHLHKNQLTQIPPELGQLTNLQYMSLSKNPNLLTPPPEIVAQGTQAVLTFLQELAREHVF